MRINALSRIWFIHSCYVFTPAANQVSCNLSCYGPVSTPLNFQRNLVGWFGLQTDRQLALRALVFAASKGDFHSVFASITLMSYWDIVLALSGWQADEVQTLERFKTVLEPSVILLLQSFNCRWKIETYLFPTRLYGRYPTGSLWALYKVQ